MTQTSLEGLSSQAAEHRIKSEGYNEIPIASFNFFQSVLSRLWEPSAWILELALLMELFLGKDIQASFIVLMLLFAAINGTIQEYRASKVLNSLSTALKPLVTVKRNGQWLKRPSRELVAGDVINLKSGNIIPADVTILDKSIYVNESSITGESMPVTRTKGSEAFSGTEIISGNCLALVIRTGIRSRAGRTSQLTIQSKAPGQLQILLGRVIKSLAILDVILIMILLLFALIRKENLISLLPFFAMLIIATIPIAMPSSFSVANAIEANVLSKKSILVRDLTGIQEAANVNLLLMDKTGTLTNNQTVVEGFHNFSSYSKEEIDQLALTAVDTTQPSQLDDALLTALSPAAHLSVKAFQPFNPNVGYSTATVNVNHQERQVKLGSLKIISQETNQIIDESKVHGHTVALSLDRQLLGFYILKDQIRPDSVTAVQKFNRRGIKVIILTGDNHKSAEQTSHQIGLTGKIITKEAINAIKLKNNLAAISEVLPENKLDVVKKFQKLGYTVGMIGDGINDAPALKQANLGIAVNTATDIAKKAAKIILMKDRLLSVVDIVDSGHRVYQRMMTWTITKLVRTAELTLLLTLGYIFFGFMPLSLNELVLIAILNDLVTLVLGTDNTTITYHPENWNFKKMISQASILTIGWTASALFILTILIKNTTIGKASTLLFVFLIASAMLTILMTRTTRPFWLSLPSFAVCFSIIFNLIIVSALAVLGLGIPQISILSIINMLLITLSISLILDMIHVWINKYARKKVNHN
ncbi:MAG: HAD-IC family P-type ATPase [Lentilactobacillus diolivorans]